YYEELGLLESVKRLDGGVRVYTNDDMRRLRFIQRLKMLGLSLQEMLELEGLYRKERTNRAVLPKLIEMLDRHLAQIGDHLAALDRARVRPELVDEVYMGNVIQAGVGQAPARQASIFAGIPNTVPCTTINKVCGSGLKSVMLAASQIRAGEGNLIVAGGMESMSNAPYLLERARTGYKFGDATLVDAMIKDGLWDAYQHQHMGMGGELVAECCDVSRELQ